MLLPSRSLTALLCLSAATAAYADVRLPAILSDHLVLQAGKPASLWGWADAGEKVTAEMGGQKAETVANAEGKWSIKMPLPAGEGPFELHVQGRNRLTVQDVLVGELWVCSGQSNMEWTVSSSQNPNEEAQAANFPKIRHFKVKKNVSRTPLEDVEGSWAVCSPATVPQFSAVGYFFGRELHQKLKGVPVGLVGTNWGGTAAEGWTSKKTFESIPELKSVLEPAEARLAAYDPVAAQAGYEKVLEAWKAQVEKAKAEGKPEPRKPGPPQSPATNPSFPANLYNAMIAPLLPLSIRGAIWYQGESNVSRAAQYRILFPAMIANWRKDFAQGDFPFHFVQLAPFSYSRGNPAADPTPCAELWEAQLHTLRTVPNTGMAVTTDIGNVKDIHPKNKQEVGRRLALWALAHQYGKKDLVYSGPLYTTSKIEGSKVRIQFEHGKGLKSRDGQPLSHFTIAAEDKNFVPAEATIEGDALVVHSPAVSKPVAVRFAWRDDAEPNLVNGAGLPASPFRTDSFPMVTEGK
jgi:sialate O-acetylesterase